MALDCKETITISSDDEESKYIYERGKGKLVIVPKQLTFYFHGIFSVSVIKGTVEINGYKITAKNSPQHVCSLSCSNHFNVKCVEGNPEWNINEDLKESLCTTDFHDIKDVLTCDDALIYCKPYTDRIVGCLNKHISADLFPPIEKYFICSDKDFGKKDVAKDPITIYNHWQHINYGSIKFRGLLCGQKSSGRSTLLRYIINRLLSNHRSICFIELDYLKPELSMPYCISVSILSTPLLGPAGIIYLQEPVRSIIMKSPVEHYPLYFLKCVRELFDYCFAMFPEYPTMINCPVLASNSEVLSIIIGYSKANILIQNMNYIGSLDEFIDLEPSKVLQRIHCGLLVKHDIDTLKYEYFKFYVPSQQFASDLFDHMLWKTVLYFTNMCDWNGFLDYGDLYRINLDAIIVLDNEFNMLDGWQKVACINANIVVLCRKPYPEECPDFYDLIGWGIVRTILEGIAYILTPTDLCSIIVTHFMVGYHSLPKSLLLHHEFNQIPYINSEVLQLS